MPQPNLQTNSNGSPMQVPKQEFDYSYVSSCAQVATYDDLRSAPRISKIEPAATGDFINTLATTIYDQAKSMGGSIPFTVIKEVSENFIHARFTEIVVSVFDKGNTIRFADQGPGIAYKEKAQQPGFSSATEPMKEYIRGVGSGLPIVKEYLQFSRGSLSIEDNMGTGAVITISMTPTQSEQVNDRDVFRDNSSAFYRQTLPASFENNSQNALNNPFVQQPQSQTQYVPYESSPIKMAMGTLTQREKDFLSVLLYEGSLGVSEISSLTEVPHSSAHYIFKKLEEAGLIERIGKAKRMLTPLGKDVAASIL